MAKQSVDIQQLTLVMSADLRSMERAMKRQEKNFGKHMRGIERQMSVSGLKMGTALSGPLSIIAGLLSAREVTRYADAWTSASNKLAASGVAMGEVANKQKELVDLAIQNRIALDGVVDLYSKTKRATADLNLEEEKLSRFVDITTKSFKAFGSAASEQNAAILQLSQGLSSGILAGDELKSLRENAPLLAEAIADYFGVTVGALKKLGAEGKLTADKVVKAVLASGQTIDAQFGKTSATFEDARTNWSTALTEYIGVVDKITGASARAAKELEHVSEGLRSVTEGLRHPEVKRIRELQSEIKTLELYSKQGSSAFNSMFESFGADLMTPRVARLRKVSDELQKIMTLRYKDLKLGNERIAAEKGAGIKLGAERIAEIKNRVPKPAGNISSFSDTETAGFQTTVDTTGLDKIKAEQDFLAVLKEKAAALEQEARLFGVDADKAELMRTQEEMLSEAKRLGIENTAEFSDAYTIMSAKMSDANAKIKEMKENEQLLNSVTSALEQGANDMFSAFLDGSDSEMKEAAKNMIKQMALILIKAIALKVVMDSIFGGFGAVGGAVGGDLLKGLVTGGINTAFGGFRENGGTVSAGKSYIVGEKRPEVFVPNTAGKIIPSLDEAAAVAQKQSALSAVSALSVSPVAASKSSGAAAGSSATSVNITNNYDFSGADASILSRIPGMMDERDRQLKAAIYKELPAVQARRNRRFAR